MIEILATESPEALRLQAYGHATGKAEVCAGVSALLYALRGWVSERERREGWPADASEARIGKGSATIRMPRTEETELAFGLVLHGLLLVHAAAPDAVSVSYGE